MSNSSLVFEDQYRKHETEKRIQAQKEGVILVEAYERSTENSSGLPYLTKLGFSVDRSFRSTHTHTWEVRTKDAELVGYADYHASSGSFAFSPAPGAELPESIATIHPLRLAEAELDEESKTVTINDDDSLITLTGVETWKDNYAMLSEINHELVKAEKGIVVWKLTRIPDESGKQKLFQKRTPFASNEQVSLTVSGYALSEHGTLAYLGVVGHKTAVNSLYATILQNKPIGLHIEGRYNPVYLSVSKYTKIMAPMPDYDAYHCAFMASQSLPGKWSPSDNSIYILQFIGGYSIEDQLVKRLNESLNLPILPEWGAELMKQGALKGFVKSLKTGGDCVTGVEITVEADWNALVEELLLADSLRI